MNVLKPNTVIEKTWEGIPGAILSFPVAIALSGTMAAERQSNIGLTPEERNARIWAFRVNVLADVLTEAPYLIRIEALQEAISSKADKAVEEAASNRGEELKADEVARIRKETRLTQAEVDALKEPFPDFPAWTVETLPAVAKEYFSREDERGRPLFQMLVEEVIEEYWFWANPRPTISVSAFMQDK